MKKILAILTASALALGMLVGCGKDTSSTAVATVDYTQIIESCRPSGTESIEIVSDTQPDQSGMLAFLGVSEDEMEKYAVSVSLMNTKAYAIALITPKDGSEAAVKNALDQFVVDQKAAFESYLPDQYEIANSAIVESKGSTIVLVMCQDSSKVLSEIEKQIKAE